VSNFEAQTPTTEAPSPSVLSEVSTDTNKEEPTPFNPEVQGLFNQANNLLQSVTLAADSVLSKPFRICLLPPDLAKITQKLLL
jgi:hypothetical protein